MQQQVSDVIQVKIKAVLRSNMSLTSPRSQVKIKLVLRSNMSLTSPRSRSKLYYVATCLWRHLGQDHSCITQQHVSDIIQATFTWQLMHEIVIENTVENQIAMASSSKKLILCPVNLAQVRDYSEILMHDNMIPVTVLHVSNLCWIFIRDWVTIL